VPLYGVILGRLGTGQSISSIGTRRVDIGAALIWIAGIAAYHALAKWAPQFGSALPTLAATFLLAWISRPKPTSTTAGGASALVQSRG